MKDNEYNDLVDFLGENFHQIDEKFQHVDEQFQHVDEQFQHVDKRFQSLESKISQLPTKSYLDDKIADLEGGVIGKLRKEDQKVNRLTQMLREKQVLTDSDVSELKELKIFPQ